MVESSNKRLYGVMLLVYAVPIVLFLIGYFASYALTSEGLRYAVAIAAFCLGIVPAILYDRSRVTDIEEISGHGVTATVDGVTVAAGNAKLMDKLGIAYQNCHSVGTIIHMAVNGEYAICLDLPLLKALTPAV